MSGCAPTSAGEAAVGEVNFTNPQYSSAAEYVVVTPDGSFGVISDEGSGIGLLKLGVTPPPPSVGPPAAPPPQDTSCDIDSGVAALAAENGQPQIKTCVQAKQFCSMNTVVSLCKFTCTGSCSSTSRASTGRASLFAGLKSGRQNRREQQQVALLPR